ncbi:MAG TPA: hypothetical protein DDZ89_05195, partial [Clostridiales bacterium]|nr:hypothetical protein [Clostridiales bacterium]
SSVKTPLHQSHIIYIKCNEPSSNLYKIPVNYINSKPVSVSFYPSEKKITPDHSLVISPIPGGHKAFVKIPLHKLNLNWSTLMINVVRVDWGISPLTSLFPIRSGFFIEEENGDVGISLLKDPSVFVDVSIVTRQEDFSSRYSYIKLESVRANKKRLTLTNDPDFSPYTLIWETPSGQRTPLNYTLQHHDNLDIIDFSNPPVKEEGFYKLHLLHHEKETFLYMDRRHLIMETRDNNNEPTPGKTHVDCSYISKEANEVLNIVPPYGGMRNTHDPRFPQLRTYGTFEYDFSNPQKIRSQKSGDLYPSPDFPETESISFTNRHGENIVYPFYRTSDGTPCYLSAALWAEQKAAVCNKLPSIAQKDPSGAAKILAHLCRRYRFYEPYSDYYRVKYPMDIRLGPPYPYYGGFWSNWFYADLSYIATIAEAYASIIKTDAFEQLSVEYRQDIASEVRNIIEEGLDFVFSYGIQNTNMDASIWEGLIRIGSALEKPEYVHMALERIDYFINHYYLFDGFFSEVTVSYHQMITNGVLRTLKRLSNYSDPTGYTYPGTGERIDQAD